MKYGAMNLPTKPVVGEIEELGKLGFDYITVVKLDRVTGLCPPIGNYGTPTYFCKYC